MFDTKVYLTILIALMMLSGTRAFAREDISYPGANCRPAQPSACVTYEEGEIANGCRSPVEVICPFADTLLHGVEVEQAYIFYKSDASSQSVECVAKSRSSDGVPGTPDVTFRALWNTDYDGAPPPQGVVGLGISGGNYELVPGGYGFFQCTIPPKSSAFKFAIISYTIEP